MSRLLMGVAVLALIVSISVDASARERARSSVTAKGGNFTSTLNADGGVRARSSTGTSAAGDSWSKSSTTTINTDSQTYTREVTGANGVTRDLTGMYGDGQTSGSYTTSSGKTGSYEHPAGQWRERRAETAAETQSGQ